MSIINNRQSVRLFNEIELEEDKLIQLVEAGMLAPSSKNKKPWQFIVINDKGLIGEFEKFHRSWKTLRTANKAIVVCGDLNLDEREIHTLMACSAASENILLKATELEVGSVWLGVYPDNIRVNWIKDRLNLPNNVVPISIIALGYSDSIKIKEKIINKDKIHFNQW